MNSQNNPTSSGNKIRVFVGCGSQKQTKPTLSKFMYTSNYFELKREYASKYGADWYIISAKHHLLAPDVEIEPYDKTLADMTEAERKRWGTTTSDQIHSQLRWEDTDTLVILLGASYIKYIKHAIESLPVNVKYLFHGTSGIGEQMKRLKSLTQSSTHDPGELPEQGINSSSTTTTTQIQIHDFE